MKCDKCGHDNVIGFSFCEECGEKLVTCPICNKSHELSNFCPYTGENFKEWSHSEQMKGVRKALEEDFLGFCGKWEKIRSSCDDWASSFLFFCVLSILFLICSLDLESIFRLSNIWLRIVLTIFNIDIAYWFIVRPFFDGYYKKKYTRQFPEKASIVFNYNKCHYK